jgi:RNA polymerase sigma-70 factor (ECF subfamily)
MTEPKTSAPADVPRWIEEARGRWPGVTLGEAEFRAYLQRLGLSAPHFPADTYLAAACATGNREAVRALEGECISRVPDVLRRVDGRADFAADICQQLRIRLLVTDDDAPPRIARYTGEVPLAAWTRVIALRLAFNAKRGAKAVGGEPKEGEGDAAIADPELDYLRAQYREPFARAFQSALGGLSKDDRTILRLHYVDGVNIDGIGRIFQVHRATVARWLVRIRSDMLARAKVLLAEQVGAELDEAESLMGALAAEIDLTLSRVLRSAPPSP